MLKKAFISTFLLLAGLFSEAQTSLDSMMFKKISDEIFMNGQAYSNLRFLCKKVGPRLSGSAGAAKAVEETARMLREAGADTVYLQPCMVPQWVRGAKEVGKATLTDGAYHDVDSSALAFEIASRAAFREGILKCAPKLLEPVMKVEVVTPEDYLGDVIGDLNSRRGQVTGMDQRGNARVINALVPLANMFGYVNTLRSMSQGRAQFSMVFDHYEQVPQNVADEIKAKMA